MCPDGEVLDSATACAHLIARLTRSAVEDTKRALNIHLERARLATLDFAFRVEDRSNTSPDMRVTLDRMLEYERGPKE